MLKEIIDIHFERWVKNTNLNTKNYLALLNNENIISFFEDRKHLMNSKHLDYIRKIKDGFFGYFEVLNVNGNKIKIRNLLGNQTYEVITNLKPLKYDIIISRIYESDNNLYLVDELTITYPYFYLKYIDLSERPFENYIKLTTMNLENKKCWDGFLYKKYNCFGSISDIKKFEKTIKKLNCFSIIQNDILILLKGELVKHIKRMPVYINDEITSTIIGLMSFHNNKVIFGFVNINFAKTFLELIKNSFHMEAFYVKENGEFKIINLDETFYSEFKEDEIYNFYSSKKNYSDEEFKFYYNLEAHFKEIGAPNFLNFFENG
ncbi:MAG: hypothetical protein ABIL52_00240 [candidate division WOR-3 bacterium]